MILQSDFKKLVLASGSSGRRKMLLEAGYDFSVVVSEVPEILAENEDPELYVVRLARAKAAAVSSLLHQKNDALSSKNVVLAADTVVVSPEGKVLEKPISIEDSIEMLKGLSGRAHYVVTGCAIFLEKNLEYLFVDKAKIVMREYDLDDIFVYIKDGETLLCSGGYSIANRAASFIERVEGSFTTVVGLPMHLVVPYLKKLGVRAV